MRYTDYKVRYKVYNVYKLFGLCNGLCSQYLLTDFHGMRSVMPFTSVRPYHCPFRFQTFSMA